MLDIENYDYVTWGEKYPNNKVSLRPKVKYPKVKVHDSWKELFEKEMKKKYINE